jgi:hypothetical protein
VPISYLMTVALVALGTWFALLTTVGLVVVADASSPVAYIGPNSPPCPLPARSTAGQTSTLAVRAGKLCRRRAALSSFPGRPRTGPDCYGGYVSAVSFWPFVLTAERPIMVVIDSAT